MYEQTLARARAGDGAAFGELTGPYRGELQVHCYRILGSVQDAEDMLQETLLAAWRGLDQFQERASLRAWLYRIATNRCLNALRDNSRRPGPRRLQHVPTPPHTGPQDEPLRLEPLPDMLLDGLAHTAPGPEARYEIKESVSLAFVTALRRLPPRQRAALVLRDVLGLHAAEVAEILECSPGAVAGALKRARTALADRASTGDRDQAPLPGSPRERAIVAHFVEAFERGDVEAVAGLLTDDVQVTMPPLPLEYRGRTAAAQFFSATVFGNGTHGFYLVPTRANAQPAFGCYQRDGRSSVANAHGLIVLTLRGDQISAFTRFLDNGVLSRFGLPRTLRRSRPRAAGVAAPLA